MGNYSRYLKSGVSLIRDYLTALNYWIAGGAVLLLSQRILMMFDLISSPFREAWWTPFSILIIHVVFSLVAETLRKLLKRFTNWFLSPIMFHMAVCIGVILFRTSFVGINRAWPIDSKEVLGFLNIICFTMSVLVAVALVMVTKNEKIRSGKSLLFLLFSIIFIPVSFIIFPINRSVFDHGPLIRPIMINMGIMTVALSVLMGGIVFIRRLVSTQLQTKQWISSPILASALPVAVLVILEAVVMINIPKSVKEDHILPIRGKEDHILFVLVDCLRADHVGCYGYSRDTTPNLDQIAKESILFRNAFSQTNWTKPSVASYFTSLYISQHGVFEGGILREKGVTGDVLDESFDTIAEEMKKAGYSTGAFLNQGQLEDYLGFAQGFDTYRNQLGNAANINRAYFEWLDKQSGPTFAYLHYLDIHEPYLPKPPFDRFAQFKSLVREEIQTDFKLFRKRVNEELVQLSLEDLNQLKALYDGEVAYSDAQCGELINGLKERGIYSKTFFLLTADHGESFLEHGKMSHGGRNLYDELIHVPLIIKFPDQIFSGKVIKEVVRLIDLFPFLCEYINQPIPTQCNGKSLFPLIRGEDEAERIAFAETEETICARSSKYKLIRDRNAMNNEFYHIVRDYSEVYNRANLISNEYQRLSQLLDIWQQDMKLLSPEKDRELILREETVKKLKSLGYLK